jgi:hypothetical protein
VARSSTQTLCDANSIVPCPPQRCFGLWRPRECGHRPAGASMQQHTCAALEQGCPSLGGQHTSGSFFTFSLANVVPGCPSFGGQRTGVQRARVNSPRPALRWAARPAAGSAPSCTGQKVLLGCLREWSALGSASGQTQASYVVCSNEALARFCWSVLWVLNRCVVGAAQGASHNTSIERTSNGRLRRPLAAAHVER